MVGTIGGNVGEFKPGIYIDPQSINLLKLVVSRLMSDKDNAELASYKKVLQKALDILHTEIMCKYCLGEGEVLMNSEWMHSTVDSNASRARVTCAMCDGYGLRSKGMVKEE